MTHILTTLWLHRVYRAEFTCYFTRSEIGESLVRSPGWPIFFPRLDDRHYDRIHSSLAAVYCFNNGYIINEGNQSVAWKEN